MSRVLVLKCEHVAEVTEISDLTASSSASVEDVFMGTVSLLILSLSSLSSALSTLLAILYNTTCHVAEPILPCYSTNVNFRECDPRTTVE